MSGIVIKFTCSGPEIWFEYGHGSAISF